MSGCTDFARTPLARSLHILQSGWIKCVQFLDRVFYLGNSVPAHAQQIDAALLLTKSNFLGSFRKTFLFRGGAADCGEYSAKLHHRRFQNPFQVYVLRNQQLAASQQRSVFALQIEVRDDFYPEA
eukprot:CAMPEP_0113724494 /NCGR_PEP_ID=MMETSP0038_2-20120614/39120_1 /TAXON_ID=2898 /ORGANISM="Cryptomonas paramecium" /LENGTH=124 /DNA_ID=CAMNT_0000654421 /DNA_START=114 /DNA_END=485 /DNA_ORIENTATION=- /assembly_acc=CAM_ASM_000170